MASLPDLPRRSPAGDGRWIKAAVDRKVARYGNANAVRDVALVIGALGLVSGDQITSFRRDVLEEELAFAEIWLVSGFEGVVRLKSRQG